MQNYLTNEGNMPLDRYQIQWEGQTIDLAWDSESRNAVLLNTLPPHCVPVDFVSEAAQFSHILLNGRSLRLESPHRSEDGVLNFRCNGMGYRLPIMTRQEVIIGRIHGNYAHQKKQSALKAPMPGLVLRVLVEEGQFLKAGEPLLVLESMKMENVLRSTFEARVSQILVKPTQTVEKGQVLINFL
jgi:biotin carboxyl carrier protein